MLSRVFRGASNLFNKTMTRFLTVHIIVSVLGLAFTIHFQMAFRLFNVYKLLRELAHPVYTKKRFLFLPCSTALELAERRVS